MRKIWRWSWLVVVTATSGCGVAKELCRYTREQIEYHEIADECLAKAHYRKLAASSWNEVEQSNPPCQYSPDYADGFVDGFVDYLNEGPGAPPVIPPRHYWTICQQTPDGHRRAEDWFEGFRAGVLAAEQSGYRSLVTVPVALPAEYTTE